MTLAILAVAAGGLLQAAGGFGFALAAAPALLAATSPEQSVSGQALLSLVVLAPTLAVRPQVVRDEVRPLVLAALPGMVLGAVVLSRVPEAGLKVLLAGGILAAVALRLRHGRISGPSSAVAAGGVAGALTTTIGLNGPPMAVHLLRRGLSPAQLRGTLAVVFVVLDVLALAILAAAGSLTLPPALGWLLLAAAGGGLAGRAVAGRLDDERAERLVLGLLLASAATALLL